MRNAEKEVLMSDLDVKYICYTQILHGFLHSDNFISVFEINILDFGPDVYSIKLKVAPLTSKD